MTDSRRPATVPVPLLLAGGGLVLAFLAGLFALVLAPSQSAESATPDNVRFVPYVARDGVAPPPPTPTRTPTPTPTPIDYGPPRSLSLASALIPTDAYIEARHTEFSGSRESFAEPSKPQYIAWYNQFSTMGRPGQNTIMAAHINYIGYGNGPFRYLTSARNGDTLSIRMDNGATLSYTVKSVEVIKLTALNMDNVVYPPLPADRERITLISCGGTFVPYRGGGGVFDSRVILVAERIIE